MNFEMFEKKSSSKKDDDKDDNKDSDDKGEEKTEKNPHKFGTPEFFKWQKANKKKK